MTPDAATPEEMEAEAGRLIVAAMKARAARLAPGDAHEMRHLFAAITAGNSDPCEGGAKCHLDAALMHRLHDATWPECPPPPAVETFLSSADR